MCGEPSFSKVPFVPVSDIIVLEQMEHPVPNRMARMKRTISAMPHVWTLARFDMISVFLRCDVKDYVLDSGDAMICSLFKSPWILDGEGAIDGSLMYL